MARNQCFRGIFYFDNERMHPPKYPSAPPPPPPPPPPGDYDTLKMEHSAIANIFFYFIFSLIHRYKQLPYRMGILSSMLTKERL